MMNNIVIVVEGKNDLAKIKSIYNNIVILTTNGSYIGNDFYLLLENYSKLNYKILLLLDPDYQGNNIRKKIKEKIPHALDIFINRSDCISKNNKKVGIEHCNIYLLKNILDKYINGSFIKKGNLDIYDLYKYKLVGSNQSSLYRNKIENHFLLGKTNSKSLLNRLNSLGITKDVLRNFYGKD